MKSDCEDSATLEEKGGEVLDYNYGYVVKSRIQWFEQLKYQALSPKPASDLSILALNSKERAVAGVLTLAALSPFLMDSWPTFSSN